MDSRHEHLEVMSNEAQRDLSTREMGGELLSVNSECKDLFCHFTNHRSLLYVSVNFCLLLRLLRGPHKQRNPEILFDFVCGEI